jgi:glycosyltransferase involved in cell wall biosynthesis
MGAQRHARMLCEGLGTDGSQMLLTLYGRDQGAARPDMVLCPEVEDRPSWPARLVALRRLRALLRQIAPSVVVAHGSEALWHASLVVRRRQLVYHRIGVSSWGSRRGLRSVVSRGLHTLLLRRPVHIVAVSHDVAAELVDEFRVPTGRVRVVANGRDPAVYFPPTERPKGPPVVGFVGHLTASKRPDLYLDVMQALPRGVPFRAVIVGDGPLRSQVEERARELSVTVFGARDDVPELLRTMDVLVFPSISEGEGLPGVLIEAALSGLAIVTTDVPGARDVVVDGVTGLIAEDAGALDKAVEALITDPALRTRLGTAARTHAEQHLSIAACIDDWRSLLADITGPSRR